MDRGLKAGQFDLNRVSAWDQIGYSIGTRGTGDRVARDLRRLVRHGDFGIGDDSAGCIRDGSGDSAKRLPV